MELLEEISEHLKKGDDKKVFELTKEAIERKISPKDILDDGLISGMNVVGELFRKHEIFLPNVLLAARAMYAGMDQLKPLLIEQGIESQGKIVIGTAQGDLHDIGKNLVGIMLKGAGFEVIDVGKDVTAEKFIDTAAENGVQIIGMSALLTTTMPVMGVVIDQLRDRGMDGEIKTIIGGAPTSEEFARDIGADAYAYDASSAVDRVRAMMKDA